MTRDPYASLKQGLVGCWIPSVSGSGLLLPDLSGRGNNGVLTNMDASDWVASGSGRALDFDGVDDVVRLPFSIEMPFTVSGWFLSRSTTAIQYAISICNSTNNAPHYSLIFDGNAVGDLIYAAQEGDATAFQGSSFTGYVANQMYHLTGVFRSSTNRQLYVNANAQTVNTTSVGTTTINRLAIGRFDRLNPVVPFDGVADDIRIYNRALTESEIRLLASEPGIGFKPAKKLSRFSTRYTYQPPKAKVFHGVRVRDHDYASLRNGLVGAWCPSLANGGSGNILPDQSGRGNHGTLVGMGPEDWVSSGTGRALDFDGVDDYVDAGDCCDFTSGFLTIAAWIKRNETATGQKTVVSKFDRSGGVTTENGILFGIFNNTISYAAVLDGTTHRFSATVADLNVTEWVHIAVKVQTNNGAAAALYRNGLQVAGSWVTLNGNVTLKDNTYSLRFGNYKYAGVNYDHFSGSMDDIRIYSRALTESEIRLLASRRGIGLQPSPTKFIAKQQVQGTRRRRILTGQT